MKKMIPELILLLAISITHSDGAISMKFEPATWPATSINADTVMTCTYTGVATTSGDLQFRWRDNIGRDININRNENVRSNVNAMMEGEYESKLYITRVQDGDAGNYTCEISFTSTGEKKVKAILLSLYVQMSFGDTQIEQHPVQDDPATHIIKCDGTGSPSPTVKWFKSSYNVARRMVERKILYGGRYKPVIRPISGLKIDNMTRADDGYYICQLEQKTLTKVLTLNISVGVYIKPKVTSPPVDKKAVAGTSIVMDCGSNIGHPRASFVWSKLDDQGQAISISTLGRFEVNPMSSVTRGYMKIAFLNKIADQRTYQCQAVNAAGHSDPARAILTVINPPKFEHQFNSTGLVNTTATVTCEVSGDLPINITWRKTGLNGNELYTTPDTFGVEFSQKDPRISVKKDKEGGRIKLHLTVKNTTPKDKSNYTCTATNEGATSVQNQSIIVQYKPNFAPTPENVSYNWLGSSRNITCEVDSEPEPSKFLWFKLPQGDLVENQPNGPKEYKMYHTGRVSMLQVTVTTGRQGNLFGSYSCNATNLIGKTSHIVQLIEAKPANIPTFTVTTTSDSAMLDISRPSFNGHMPVTAFKVEYRKDGDLWKHAQPNPKIGKDAAKVRVEVKDLNANTDYEFKVAAINVVGLSQTKSVTGKTKQASLPGKIKITSKTQSDSSKQYRLQWVKPSDGGITIQKYVMTYIKVDCATKKADGNGKTEDLDANDNLKVLTDLTPNTCYRATIVAVNKKGSSPESSVVFQTQKEGGPIGPPAAQTGREDDTGLIIGIVIAIFFLILIIIDIGCYFVNDWGVTKLVCIQCCSKKANTPVRMEEGVGCDKYPLNNEAEDQKLGANNSLSQKMLEAQMEADEDMKPPIPPAGLGPGDIEIKPKADTIV